MSEEELIFIKHQGVAEFVQKLVVYMAKESYQEGGRFTGLPAVQVIETFETINKISELTGILEDTLGIWYNNELDKQVGKL